MEQVAEFKMPLYFLFTPAPPLYHFTCHSLTFETEWRNSWCERYVWIVYSRLLSRKSMQYGLCKINKSVPPLTRFFFTHIVISWCITICAVVEQIWHYFDFDLLWKRITQRCFVTRRETTRWRIVESPQHSMWHLARMLLECSWELLQNVMAWFLNYVCRVVATRDARWCDTDTDARKDARDCLRRRGRGRRRRERSSSPLGKYVVERSAFNSLTHLLMEVHARVIAVSSFLHAVSCRTNVDPQLLH